MTSRHPTAAPSSFYFPAPSSASPSSSSSSSPLPSRKLPTSSTPPNQRHSHHHHHHSNHHHHEAPAHSHDSQAKVQSSTMPLLLGLTPMVFSFVLGNGQAAAEFLFFVLAMFWLYFSAKVPWDLYFRYQSPVSLGRAEAGKVMFRMQALMLVFACAFPVLGGMALYQFKEVFPHYSVLISEFNISLFILVALIKPSQEIAKLFHDHATQLHQELAYPSEDLAHLCQRIEKLENDLFSMRDIIATQEELIGVQEVMKPALSRILETIKETKTREEENSQQATKKIKELEDHLNSLEPTLKKKRGMIASFLMLPVDLFHWLKDLLLSPFVWSSKATKRVQLTTTHQEESRPSSKGLKGPEKHSKKAFAGELEDEVPLRLHRKKDRIWDQLT